MNKLLSKMFGTSGKNLNVSTNGAANNTTTPQPNTNTTYGVERFIAPQERDYRTALAEVRAGRKISHWIWYIFPQLRGLGRSEMSYRYGIADRAEAQAYLANATLNGRLREITSALLVHVGKSTYEIFSGIDAMKVKSSMTLFDAVSPNDIYGLVLERFYNGERCNHTLSLLNVQNDNQASAGEKVKIYNLVILDESGSMYSIYKPAVDSVNETLQTIHSAQSQYEDQEHLVSIVTFNDEVKIIHDCCPIGSVGQFTQYNPNCSTALYDAMGISLNSLRSKVRPGDKVLVTIVTDGEENSSHIYSASAIKSLVEELKAQGWVFAYIGANQDVYEVSKAMSIDNCMSYESTEDGTGAMSVKLENRRMRWFDNVSKKQDKGDDFFL